MILTFLTLLQSTGVIPPTPPVPDHDVFAPTEEIHKRYDQEKPKRKRLTKKLVKEIKKVSVSQPTVEQLTTLAKVAIPEVSEADTAHLTMDILAQIDLMGRAIQEEAANEARKQALLEEIRRKVIIEQIARYMQMMEDDEILLMHII